MACACHPGWASSWLTPVCSATIRPTYRVPGLPQIRTIPGAAWLTSRYLRRMAFFTEVTPGTSVASLTALSMFFCDLTKPLNCTTPL